MFQEGVLFMSDQRIRRMVLSALFAALCTVTTLVIQVPSPMQGYVNLGDCAVLLSAWLLGPWYGGAAAGVGSLLADLFSGYAYYAPGTLAVKFAMAALAGWSFRALSRSASAPIWLARGVSGVLGEAVMVLGYFGYAGVWLGSGPAAAASIPGNLVQGLFGLAAACGLHTLLRRAPAAGRI